MAADMGEPGERGGELLAVFPGSTEASIDLVGGKAMSLIRLCAAGFAVPPGVVINSAFFQPWFATMLASAEWQRVQEEPPEDWSRLCEALKERALALPVSEVQQQALDTLRGQLRSLTACELFAVRSSSPQEDLPGASFAGGYTTRLGVAPPQLLDAVRDCFASAFDQRVFAYRAARGLRLDSPRMAVIVQAQLDSAVAGVAFSLNPLSNDHDEAVIDANWGQGETVVAGMVTPDHWVLDKCSGRVVQCSIHDKQLSRWLQADGRLIDRHDHRRTDACLDADQLAELLELVRRIESLFQHPVDIEWAFAAGRLHVLQARPVTTFVPLPARMVSAPGQRRRLYMDIALSSGFTINAPISPLGLDVFRRLAGDLARVAFGGHAAMPEGDDTLIVFAGGRMYLDLSNALWLGGPRLLAAKMRIADAMVASILDAIDPTEYRSLQRPRWARLHQLWRLPVAWWRLRRLLINSVFPLLAPQRWHRRLLRQLADYERVLATTGDDALPLDEFWQRHVASRLQTLFEVSMAGVGPGVLAVQAFVRLAEPITRTEQALRAALDRGFEGNVVVAMSIAMQRLARCLPRDCHDAVELERRLQAGELSAEFNHGWRAFLGEFGDRGPLEMDIAQPRYADAPRLALAQIAAMAASDEAFDLAAACGRQIAARRTAAAAVMRRAGPIRRLLLQRLHAIIERYAGLRDTPKHHLLASLHGLRRRLLVEGEHLYRAGRLDAVEHVFDLAIDELSAARSTPDLDLRSIRCERRRFYQRLQTQVINFPSMIDSRGRILRPPRGVRRDGEFSGVALSPGIVRGPARTLRSPHEKPLVQGEILIAYTTDPGWTPIFTRAAAVVLEIGGALQHGAVVARELGLPCVAGIEGISTAIRDGQLIEVDGHLGTVRLLHPPA